jgi:ATP-dependent RNA helicase DDX5/DBP2
LFCSDVKDVRHVINWNLPSNLEDYGSFQFTFAHFAMHLFIHYMVFCLAVHRIGRTGRAGATGDAHSILTTEEGSQASKLMELMKDSGQEISAELQGLAASARFGGGGKGRRGGFGGGGGAGFDRTYGGNVRSANPPSASSSYGQGYQAPPTSYGGGGHGGGGYGSGSAGPMAGPAAPPAAAAYGGASDRYDSTRDDRYGSRDRYDDRYSRRSRSRSPSRSRSYSRRHSRSRSPRR